MFYILKCLDPSDKYLAMISSEVNAPFRTWLSGEAFDESPEIPLLVKVTSDKQTVWAEMWETPLPIMSLNLFKLLEQAGVDNIDTYPVILDDPFNQKKSENGYLAFNVVGIVSALDIHKSISSASSTIIHQHIFRLAESTSTLVVSQAIRNAVENSGLKSLSFLKPESWLAFVPEKN